mmetsp:Transcript_23819/g.74425  ORF Transcript_23819/g.74425 Transcript_23819/m.74425 type:complete len:93 (-) Transcript_23819:470-748(-)
MVSVFADEQSYSTGRRPRDRCARATISPTIRAARAAAQGCAVRPYSGVAAVEVFGEDLFQPRTSTTCSLARAHTGAPSLQTAILHAAEQLSD